MKYKTRDYVSKGDADWLNAGGEHSPETGESYPHDHLARGMLEAILAREFQKRVLKEFARLSQDYPTLPLILTDRRLTIPCTAPDEFTMTIEAARGHYTAHLGGWRDEFALAGEAVELVEAALRGEIRLRIDIDAMAQHFSAERRLANGEWITLPQYEDTFNDRPSVGVVRTIYLQYVRHLPQQVR
jgi:hypothetical protein